jgi:hypothetical protein
MKTDDYYDKPSIIMDDSQKSMKTRGIIPKSCRIIDYSKKKGIFIDENIISSQIMRVFR